MNSTSTVKALFVLFSFLVSVHVVLADVIHVPADQPTIQAGINAAADGDEVLIADGTYTAFELSFGGKSITVRSASGDPSLCTIDCSRIGRGFNFFNGEGPDSVLSGLTITNGGTYSGGDYGGAVLCDHSNPSIINCVFSHNSLDHQESSGGAVCNINSDPIITNCTFLENYASQFGGGLSNYGSNPVLTNCTFIGNSVGLPAYPSGGAGIYNSDSNPVLINCMFEKNHALNGDGGGMYSENSAAEMTNCVFVENTADNAAGSVHIRSNPTITNCTYYKNTSVYVHFGDAIHFLNCNQAVVTNSIFWDNLPESIDSDSSNTTVIHSVVQYGPGHSWCDEGCIDVDPQFAEGDLYLSPGSPCIDAGTSDVPGGLVDFDIEGNPREIDGDGDAVAIVDMGAFEQDPAVAIVSTDATDFEFFSTISGPDPADQVLSIQNAGGGSMDWEITGVPTWLMISPSTGTSSGEVDDVLLQVDIENLEIGSYSADLHLSAPQAHNDHIDIPVTVHISHAGPLVVPDVYVSIQDAIDEAVPGDEIHLADGRYVGERNRDLDFGGKAITLRSISGDPVDCIIDCQGSGRGLVFRQGEGRNTVVSGLTIMKGDATGDDSDSRQGGGIFCEHSSPTLVNCIISSNTAITGGGIYCHFSNPHLIQCAICWNSSPYENAGIYCTYSNPVLENCLLYENIAEDEYGYGGGMICPVYSTPRISNCVFWGNAPRELVVGDDADVAYSLVPDGAGQPWFGFGCIDEHPLFVDPDGADNDPTTWEDNDFRLRAGSPCIDAGKNELVPADEFDLDGDGDVVEPLSLDLKRNPRFVEDPDSKGVGGGVLPIVDMGVIEYRPSTTLHVPAVYATIQHAIDTAIAGDEIVIADGRYTGEGNKNLDFRGKAITVRSESGDPALCIIDCEGDGRGFVFRTNEEKDSVVEGLSITDGFLFEKSGAGIYCSDASPTISNCVFIENEATGAGGFLPGKGGALALSYSSAIIVDCIFERNSGDAGGAVNIDRSNPLLLHCHFRENLSDLYGGGVRSVRSNPSLINCHFSGNVSYNIGGGMDNSLSDSVLLNCQFSGNTAYFWNGGGMSNSNSNPILSGCVFSGNSASGEGGGIYNSSSSPVITNCILWGNSPDEIVNFTYSTPSDPVVTFSTVQDGSAETWFGQGCIDVDPLFVDADGKDDDPWTWKDNNYRLAAGSPCIDAGNNTAVPVDEFDLDNDGNVDEPIPFDLLGDSRFEDDPDTDDTGYGTQPVVDMGAIEYRIPVTRSVPGEYLTIQDGINAAADGDEVVLADGTYAGDGNKNLDFDGKAITVRSESGDPSLCVIDCEGEGRGFIFRHDEGSSSIVRGVTITEGFVLGQHGGGVVCRNSSPLFQNCVFSANSSLWIGAAEYGFGGASYNKDSDPIFMNCIFDGNYAFAGGALYNVDSSPVLVNCLWIHNDAYYDGGGALFNASGSSPLVSNSILWDNRPDEIRNSNTAYPVPSPVVTFSVVQDGSGEPWFSENCLSDNPLFMDSDGVDDNPYTWQDNDYRLAAGSPCIDAGDNDAVPTDQFDLDSDGDVEEPIPFDLLGHLRFVDDPDTVDTGSGEAPIVDMGAYEYQLPVQGDLDQDGDVDLDDYALFADCLAGPGVTVPPVECDPIVFEQADLEEDKDVDLKDFELFQQVFEIAE